MDVTTILIVIVLVLACIGLWLVVGFLRYRVYFRAVNAMLTRTKFGSLYEMPTDEMLRLDDVVKRCYFAKVAPQQAVAAVIDEDMRYRNLL